MTIHQALAVGSLNDWTGADVFIAQLDPPFHTYLNLENSISGAQNVERSGGPLHVPRTKGKNNTGDSPGLELNPDDRRLNVTS